jgi:hypothetical protein
VSLHAWRFRWRLLPFGRLRYCEVGDAIDYAMHSSRSHDDVIRVYDEAGNVIKTHEDKGEFKEPGTGLH